MTQIRTAALVIAGFLLLAGAGELEAQGRDTSSARAQAFPKPAKAKARAARDTAVKDVLPAKEKSAPTPPRAESLPAITKPPKAPRPPA